MAGPAGEPLAAGEAGTPALTRIGVVGAGDMGAGIAQVCAMHGYAVQLADRDPAALARARKVIGRNLDRSIARGKMTVEIRDAALARIACCGALGDLTACDLVIEAVTENEEVKRAIYRELLPALRPEVVVASNTSSISITRLAAATDRPGKFIGMHFMNPAPIMALVELIPGIATDKATVTLARNFVLALGKTPVAAEDFPAFIVNRILLPMINEAVYTLHEGVGTVDGIDAAMRLGAKHPMGPLELADFIGLDTCLSIMQVLHDGLADSKYRPCPLLVKYVDAGWLGRKTGRGFYDYRGTTPAPTR